MDNIENYLYLLFAVIYIVSRIMKARSKQKQVNAPSKQQQQSAVPKARPEPKKAFSFEDILKEFEKNLGGEELYEEKPEPVLEQAYETPKPAPVPTPEPRPSIYETYEGMTYESTPDYEDSESADKEKSFFGGYNAYKTEKSVACEFGEKLMSPNGFREAFIMSEIINRKY
jgi:hypothetical protein